MGPVELESFGEKHALGLEDNSSISQFGTGGSEHIPIRCDPSKRLLFTSQLVQEPGSCRGVEGTAAQSRLVSGTGSRFP